MSENWTTKLKSMKSSMGALGAASPDTMKAFGGLVTSANKEGALNKKTKELMAVAISICIRCEGCIAYHVHNAVQLGAVRDEIIETINLAIEMGGGPSTVYGAKALEAFNEFFG